MGLCSEIAVIDLSLAAAEERLQIKFDRDIDDLDWFSAAIFTIGEKTYALERYDNMPRPGLTLIAMEGDGDPASQVKVFLAGTGLPASAL